MRIFCGMLCIRYFAAASLFQNLRSLTCVHASLSSSIALIHGSLARSSETPSTVKFFVLNFSYALTTFGFSMRHGLHQLAQKSTSTNLPRKEDNATVFPSVSF